MPRKKCMANVYIVPRYPAIAIDGEDKDDAICNFATSMNSDMNQYFEVLTPEECERHCGGRLDAEAQKRFVIAFVRSVLVEKCNMQEDAAQDIAEVAYSIYG